MSKRVKEFMYEAAVVTASVGAPGPHVVTGGTAPVALLALALLLN